MGVASNLSYKRLLDHILYTPMYIHACVDNYTSVWRSCRGLLTDPSADPSDFHIKLPRMACLALVREISPAGTRNSCSTLTGLSRMPNKFTNPTITDQEEVGLDFASGDADNSYPLL